MVRLLLLGRIASRVTTFGGQIFVRRWRYARLQDPELRHDRVQVDGPVLLFLGGRGGDNAVAAAVVEVGRLRRTETVHFCVTRIFLN